MCGRVVSNIQLSTLILTCLWTSGRVLTKALKQSVLHRKKESQELSSEGLSIRALTYLWSVYLNNFFRDQLGKGLTHILKFPVQKIVVRCSENKAHQPQKEVNPLRPFIHHTLHDPHSTCRTRNMRRSS